MEENALKEEVYSLIGLLKNNDLGTNRVAVYDTIESNSAIYESIDEMPVIGEYNSNSLGWMLNGHYFNEDENDAVMLVSNWNHEIFPSGKTVNYTVKKDNIDFKVIGYINYLEDEGFIVPVDYYINNYKVSNLVYTYAGKLNKQQRKDIYNKLSNTKYISSYEYKVAPSPFMSPEFLVQFIQIVLIMSVALVNIFAMINFWIVRIHREYNFYLICGAKKKDIKKIIIVQTMLITSLGIGSIVFLLLNDFFGKMNLIYSKSKKEYAIVVVIIYVFTRILANKECEEDRMYIVAE